jgi:PKD repeat protein
LVSVFINNASLYIGQNGAVPATGNPNDPLILTPVTVPSPILRAGPFVGQEPLHVDLTALVPLANLNAVGTLTGASWDFGDGTPVVTDSASTLDEVNQTTAAHIYEKAGVYTATVTLTGSSGSLPVTSQQILVHRIVADPLASTPSFQLLGVSFVGAFAAPLSNGGNPVQVSEGSTLPSYDITNDGQPPLINAATGKVYQESRRDTAGFDIDRFPKIAQTNASDFHPTEEDSDFGDPSKLVYVSGDGSVSLPYLVRTYAQLTANEQADAISDISPNTFVTYAPPQVGGQVIPDRFRLVPTLGGSVFATDSPKVGDFVLQVGRVEP